MVLFGGGILQGRRRKPPLGDGCRPFLYIYTYISFFIFISFSPFFFFYFVSFFLSPVSQPRRPVWEDGEPADVRGGGGDCANDM